MILDGVIGRPVDGDDAIPLLQADRVRRPTLEHRVDLRRRLPARRPEHDPEQKDGEQEVGRRAGADRDDPAPRRPDASRHPRSEPSLSCLRPRVSERVSTPASVATDSIVSSSTASLRRSPRHRAPASAARTGRPAQAPRERRLRGTRRHRTAVDASCREWSRSRRAGRCGSRSRCRSGAPWRSTGRTRSRTRADACERRSHRRSGRTRE